jgi:hypothetical protein
MRPAERLQHEGSGAVLAQFLCVPARCTSFPSRNLLRVSLPVRGFRRASRVSGIFFIPPGPQAFSCAGGSPIRQFPFPSPAGGVGVFHARTQQRDGSSTAMVPYILCNTRASRNQAPRAAVPGCRSVRRWNNTGGKALANRPKCQRPPTDGCPSRNQPCERSPTW